MAKNTKSTQIALAKQLIAGTSQHLANTSQLGFASATFTPAQVIASLQTLIDLRQGVDTAKATAKARLAEEKAKAPALRSFMAALESFVKVTFGNSPDVLADFGLHPRKARAPLKGTAKAAAAAKSKATRSARNTMGSQQRKAVKGDVTRVVVTPVVATEHVVQVSNPQSAPASNAGATAGATPHTA